MNRMAILSSLLLFVVACDGSGGEFDQSNAADAPPVITLLGSSSVEIETGGSFNDPGAEATDEEDGNLTGQITIESNVDTSRPGNYTVIYRVTDSAGHTVSVQRDVTVIDAISNGNAPPEISLAGGSIYSVAFAEDFSDPGFTASDTEDGDLTSNVVVNGQVDTRIPGEYEISYSVTDSNAVTTTVVRQVTVLAAAPKTTADAARFLARATFGPKADDVSKVLELGYESWIDQQTAAPATLQLPALLSKMEQYGHQTNERQDPTTAWRVQLLRNDAWLDAVVNGNDQLRQRVAFALTQIFVVSVNDDLLAQMPQGVANYNDIMVRHAFGNYRELLEEVTLSPIMGIYLSMRRNEKANDAENIQPDENYAREIMQLFSIGLDRLNPDGTPHRDSNGRSVPAYTQQDILNFARVFTGWNYGNAPRLRSNFRDLESELIPMRAFEEFHDSEAKTLLLGETLAAGQSAAEDLEAALDNLFNHPNVGPFISKHLIQQLVTSNPDPDYIERVAAVFADNGNGVRGDLGATIRAILLDADALLGHEDAPQTFGKLKEPLIKLTNVWRAFDATPVVPDRFRFAGTDFDLGQQHLKAPSVFNFFQQDYAQPGEIRDSELLSPEFQILNESTGVNLHNELYIAAYSVDWRTDNVDWNKNQITLDLEAEKAIADDVPAMVDLFSIKLMGQPLPASTRDQIITYVQERHLNDDGEHRAEEALYLIVSSPAFAVQQ